MNESYSIIKYIENINLLKYLFGIYVVLVIFVENILNKHIIMHV